MEHWQVAAEEAKKKREFAAKWPLIGKRVRKKRAGRWDEGIVTFEGEYFIQFISGGSEELIGLLPYELWNEENKRWIEF